MLFIVICIILGMFLNAGSVIILIAPLAHKALVPLGFDGIWLGVIMVKMFELAVITPPVALNLYVTQTLIPESTIGEVIHGTIPYLVMECVSIFILILFPQISTWLPSIAYGK
jgi:TRAP-type C4-dicarboxylate transport system permease large subunit